MAPKEDDRTKINGDDEIINKNDIKMSADYVQGWNDAIKEIQIDIDELRCKLTREAGIFHRVTEELFCICHSREHEIKTNNNESE